MRKKAYIQILLLFSLLILFLPFILSPVQATDTIYLDNVNNDYTIDGYTNVWFNISSDQRDISVKYDSNIHRIITGVRVHYRTARFLADYADCPTTYKFESGSDWVDYNDDFPNTTGSDQVHMFNCQGDIFLITNTFFYISIGVGSDDPFIQVGVDTDRSGHSEYSLNGGAWTLDTVEYLIEALVENVSILEEDTNRGGKITYNDDFVDAYNITLVANDDAHFNLNSIYPNEYFNIRLFNGTTKLTSDGNAIWMEEGGTSQKAHHYIPTLSQDFVLLVEPNTDGVDNATYIVNWTYAPDPPELNVLPGTDDDGNISLNWIAPIDSDLNYYNVYRSTTPNVPIDLAHRISTPGTVTLTEYEDNYLANGTYYYAITSIDNTGHESIASNETFTIVGDVIKPATPSLDIPESYPIDNDGIILINWTFENPNDASSCNIYRSNIPNFELNSSTLLTNRLKPSTILNDQVLLNGIYYYKVAALDINGLESNKSNEVNTTYIDITPPSIPQYIEPQILDDNNVYLSWYHINDLDRSHYIIYRSTQQITQADLSNLTPISSTPNNYFTDENLSSGTYYYVIVAVDLNGFNSGISESFSITIPDISEDLLLLILSILIPIIIGLVATALLFVYKQKNGIWLWKDEKIKRKFSAFKGKVTGAFAGIKEKKLKKSAASIKTKKKYKKFDQIEISNEAEFELELTEDELDFLKTSQVSDKIKDDELKDIWKKSVEE